MTVLCSFLISVLAAADFQTVGAIKSHRVQDDRVEFAAENALLNIYLISSDMVRFRYTQRSEFSEAPSYAVVASPGSFRDFTLVEEEQYFEIRTADLMVRIRKNPCRIAIYDRNSRAINEDDESFGVCFDCDEVRCFKKLLDDEQFYGLGEKTGALDKRGNQYTMWNSDKPGYSDREDPLYVSVPFFIGVREHKAYGIFFDNSYRSCFNMGASNRRFYWFGADKGELDYYFLYGPQIQDVISSYTALTGRMELPPLWALGYQQSKWSYYPESTVRALAQEFRERKIPCDVIYLDIHYMDGYRVFTWDKERFPDPGRILSDLNAQGFKVVPIIDPGVKADDGYFVAQEGLAGGYFARYPDGEVYQGEVWPSWAYFPDFSRPETREWWGEKLSAFVNQGVSGFWNDMNEPAVWGQAVPDIVEFCGGVSHKKIHNVYGLLMAQATFDGLRRHFPQRRPFILTRAGFAGTQRYAAVWTGDNIAREDHLRLACVMCQGMGLSGLPFVGADVGGFIGNPSQRLYTRWVQLGAFTPFFRGHSATGQQDKEPWAFGEEVERRVRDAISLRYRLLPFWYAEFYRAAQTGLPVMRPMFLNYQQDENCYSRDAQFQFMLGEDLLVAPVLGEHDDFKKVYLPGGKWLDFWTGEVREGGHWTVEEAPIDRIPLFVKEGGIIPMQEVAQFVGEKTARELSLVVFPTASGRYSLYEDDGVSCDYRSGVYSLTDFTVAQDGQSLSFKVERRHQGYQPQREHYLLKFFDISALSEVQLDGVPLAAAAEEPPAAPGYFFDARHHAVVVKVPCADTLEIIIK